MPLSDKSNHSSSDQHKNKTKQQRDAAQIWCEDCGEFISDKIRHFKVKFTKPTELRTQPRTQLRTQLCTLVKMLK